MNTANLATENGALIEALARAEVHIDMDERVAFVDASKKVVNLRDYDEKPNQSRAKHESLGSFCHWVNTFADKDSRIFVSRADNRVRAICILEYVTEDGEPADVSKPHNRAEYVAELSPEWLAWTGANGLAMAHFAFAEWIETRALDITFPVGATLLELIRDLSANPTAEFKSAVRLQSGAVNVVMLSEDGVKSRDGLELPASFTLTIPVYRHSARVEISAKLRYRLRDGQLSLFFVLHRVDDVIDAAIDNIHQAIETMTKIVPFLGQP